MRTPKPTIPGYTPKEWMGLVASCGCIACRIEGKGHVPASIHHLQGRKRNDYEVLPLCPDHHQHGKLAIHRNKKGFRERYGKEDELLADLKHFLLTNHP